MMNIKFNYKKLQHATFQNPVTASNSISDSHWFNVIDHDTSLDLSSVYENACQLSSSINKWVLIINPEKLTLEQLALSNKIDRNKVLNINVNKVKINVESIVNTLLKGNCSKVIICDPLLTKSDIKQLKQSAIAGQTQCYILKTKPTIH